MSKEEQFAAWKRRIRHAGYEVYRLDELQFACFADEWYEVRDHQLWGILDPLMREFLTTCIEPDWGSVPYTVIMVHVPGDESIVYPAATVHVSPFVLGCARSLFTGKGPVPGETFLNWLEHMGLEVRRVSCYFFK